MPNYGSINNNGNVETAKFNTNNRQINYSNGFSSESINLNNSNTFNTQQDTSNMYYDLSLVNTEKTTAEKAKDWFTSLTKDKNNIEDLRCSTETKTVLQALEDTSATFDDPIKEKEAEIKALDDQIALSQQSGLSVNDPNYNIAATTYSMDDVNRMINERNQKQQELNDLKAEKATVDSYLYQLKHAAKLEPYDNIALTEDFQSYTYNASELNEISDIKKNAEYMSEEQKKMYAYLYNRLGEDSATSYFEIIQDEINQAKGAEQAAEFLNNLDYTNMSKEELEESLSNYFKVGGKGLVDGIDTFCTGIENAIASDGVLSADDYAKSIILQELSEKSKAMDEVYQFSSSFGNMVIPMISSAVINAATKTDVGNKVGSLLMGLSAYGNAQEQALVNGNSKLSSTLYGIGIGVSETTLGYFLGKIPGLSSESGFTLRNLLSEGIEEGLQEYVDSGMQAVILGEDVDWSTVPEQALTSFVMGVAMAGVLNGGQAVLNITVNGKKQEVSIDQLVELLNNTEGDLTIEQIENIATTASTDTTIDTNTNAQVSNNVQSVYSYNATGKTLAALASEYTSVLQQNMSQVTNQSIDTNYDEISVKSHFQKLSLDPSNLENLLMDGLNLSMLVENGKNNSVALGGVYDIHNYLINHNSTYRQTWEVINNNKHVNCDLELSTNGESYHQRNQGIRISNQIVLSNSIETYFHEIGHALLASNVIDFKIKNRQFNQLLKKHKKSIMRNQQILSAYNAQFRRLATDMANQIASQKNFNWPAERTQYIGQLSEGIERNSGFTAISDIYDAVTNGKARDSGVVSYGHGSSYYTSSRSRFHETFANFHAIICINNPTLTKMAKTLLGDEIWNFLLQTYNEAHNTHITPKNVGTTDAMSWFPGETLAASASEYTSVVQPNMSQVTNQSIDTNYNEINAKTTDTMSLFGSQSTIRESISDLNADQIMNSDIDLNQGEIKQILHMGLETTMLGELINKDFDTSQAIYDINKFLKSKFPTYAEAWQRIHENWAVRCSLSLSQVESFYDGKGVKIDVNSVQSNYFEVYFHEVGHALLSSCLFHYYQFVEQINPYIHYYGKKIMDNEPLLVNYWKEIMSNATVMAEQEASSKTFSSDAERLDYVNNLSEAIIRNSGFASVIDIYDALTGGKAFSNGDISYGHGSSYYKNRHKDTQFQEMFADFHALKCINNAKAIDFGRKLIGDDIWNILENVYDVIINHKMSGDIRTIRVLADRNAPTYRSSNLATNYVQKFDYIIQNMSQKYPDWLLHLQTYAKDGNLNHITRYNHCRSVVQDIPFAEFQQMINSLDTHHIIASMAEDQMLKDLPRVVNQFLSNEGTAYHKLININSIAKDYPSLYEYNQFMNKYSEQNGYMILDQNGYFKHIKYGIQPESIEHRLYINCEPTVTYQFLDYFAEECKRQGLSFYFKTAYLYDNVGNPQNQNALTRSESAVIYMSGEDAIKYINICKKIKHDHPELNFYAPPVATGSIDGWLGYGKEPSGLTRQIAQAEGISLSFNSIRSLILERGIYSGIKKCISRNMYFQYDNGYTLYGALANELFNEIVTRYPNLSLDSKNILYNNLFTNPDMFMKAINSSRSGWSFYAKTEGSSQLTTFLVDSNMVNRSLSNVYYQYLSNDPAVYTYITNSIKDEANYFHIDTEHLYMDQ